MLVEMELKIILTNNDKKKENELKETQIMK